MFGELILVAALSIPPQHTSFRGSLRPSSVRHNREMDIFYIMRELEELNNNENTEDFIMKPTTLALSRAEFKVQSVYRLMGDSFFAPVITPDGEGGIDLEWTRGERTLLLGCRADFEQRDYIYHQSANEYDSKQYSLNYLKDRLFWLLSRT